MSELSPLPEGDYIDTGLSRRPAGYTGYQMREYARQGAMDRDEAWFRACKEIIDRCVAPDMYGNARAMLDRAYSEARKTAA